MENKKVIKLNEKDQKDLFCAAWHLTNFIEDYKGGKLASFSTPCETCKYQKECLENDHFNAYSHFETLTKLTGVIFSPANGARKNSFNFFNEELIEDFQEQSSININKLRVENGLKPIPNGDADFIPIK